VQECQACPILADYPRSPGTKLTIGLLRAYRKPFEVFSSRGSISRVTYVLDRALA
jgi:hypothetical protein